MFSLARPQKAKGADRRSCPPVAPATSSLTSLWPAPLAFCLGVWCSQLCQNEGRRLASWTGRPGKTESQLLEGRFDMYACPTCNASSITFFRKWLSYPALPAYCAVCGSYSHAHRSSGGLGLVVAAIGITASGFLASELQQLWPLLCGTIATMTFYISHWHRTQLEKLPPELVWRARKTEAMGNIALLLAVLLN